MPAGVSGPGAIEVFWESPEDGSRLDVVTRAVTFAPKDTVAVQVYWGNSVLDPEAACSAVFAASRFVPSRTQIYRAVLEELLRGPTAEEKERGYFTSVPHGARVRSVAADERGVVRADFTEELGRVAGSCRVIAIRAQIERTLAQFPEVRDVVISVNGRTEDILQP
jgi:spore germination protein GerM